MKLLDVLVVGGLLLFAAVIVLSVFFPQLNVLFGNFFDGWSNTAKMLVGISILVLMIVIGRNS